MYWDVDHWGHIFRSEKGLVHVDPITQEEEYKTRKFRITEDCFTSLYIG